VKPAQLSILGTILIQERQIGLIEFAEKLVPFDFLKSIFRWAEVNPKDAGMPVLFGGSYRGRPPLALLCPFLDYLVISRGFAVAHLAAPFL